MGAVEEEAGLARRRRDRCVDLPLPVEGLEVEGFGIVYLEAPSCGLRIDAGASGGAPEAAVMARRKVFEPS